MPSVAFSNIRGRLVPTISAWVLIGGLVGAQIGLQSHGGLVGVISNILAGAIVLFPVGVLLALFSDGAARSLIGALWGMLVGLLTTRWLGPQAPEHVVGLCGMIGALTAATCWPCLRGAWALSTQLSRWAGKLAVLGVRQG